MDDIYSDILAASGLAPKKPKPPASNDEAIASALIKGADALGVDPEDYATAISYESAGSFDPWRAGPTTKWGQHRGTIQYGEPQRKKYGVFQGQSFEDQVTKSNVNYLRDSGVKPGSGFREIYAAINGGSATKNLKTPDANTGRTIADNIRIADTTHRPQVRKRFGAYFDASRVPSEDQLIDHILGQSSQQNIEDDILTAAGLGSTPQTKPQNNVVPESNDTITAQAQAAMNMADKNRYGVVTTSQAQNAVFGNLSDFQAVNLGNDKTFWAYVPKMKKLKLRTPKDIDEFFSKRPDMVQKYTGTAVNIGDKTDKGATVLTTDPHTGTELSAKIVATPKDAARQVEIDKASFPQGQSQIVDAQDVVARRSTPVAGKAEEVIAPDAVPDAVPQATGTPYRPDTVQPNVNAEYANWLKTFDGQDSNENRAEFNRLMLGVAEAANAQNKKDFDAVNADYQQRVNAYNAKLPTQRAAQPPSKPTVQNTDNGGMVVEVNFENAGKNENRNAYQGDVVARAVSEKTGIPYERIRAWYDRGTLTNRKSGQSAGEDFLQSVNSNRVHISPKVLAEWYAGNFADDVRNKTAQDVNQTYKENGYDDVMSQIATQRDIRLQSAGNDPLKMAQVYADAQDQVEKYKELIERNGGTFTEKGRAGKEADDKSPAYSFDPRYGVAGVLGFKGVRDALLGDGSVDVDTVEKGVQADIKKYGSIDDALKAYKKQDDEVRFSREAGTGGTFAEAAKTVGRYVAKLPATVGELGAVALDLNPLISSIMETESTRKSIMSATKQYRDAIDADLALGQNPAYKSDFVANQLADVVAQLGTQAILTPLTGGASLALPIAEAGTSQYRQADEKGADQRTRLGAFAIGGILAVPEVLLQAKYFKGLTPPKMQLFFNNVKSGIVSRLIGTVGKEEAEVIAQNTVRGIAKELGKRGVTNIPTEIVQERGEDFGNELYEKATYNPNLKWKDIFVPSEEKVKGYMAAGLGGGIGAVSQTVIEQMSNTELAKAEAVLPDLFDEYDVPETEQKQILDKVKSERKKRIVTLKPIDTKDAQIQTKVSPQPAQVAANENVPDAEAAVDAEVVEPETNVDAAKKRLTDHVANMRGSNTIESPYKDEDEQYAKDKALVSKELGISQPSVMANAENGFTDVVDRFPATKPVSPTREKAKKRVGAELLPDEVAETAVAETQTPVDTEVEVAETAETAKPETAKTPLTNLDVLLDKVTDTNEVTIAIKDDISREQIERVEKAAAARGMTAAFDGKNFLVRQNIKPTAQPAPPETQGKEPWQQTRSEFTGDATERQATAELPKVNGAFIESRKNAKDADHRKAVEDAIARGEDVPDNVLADYPWMAADKALKPYVDNLSNLSDAELKAESEQTGKALNDYANKQRGTLPKPGDQAYFEISNKFNAVNREMDDRKAGVRLTKDQYFEQWLNKTIAKNQQAEFLADKKAVANIRKQTDANHRRVIANAVAKGKDVPQAVLEQYPDLAKRAAITARKAERADAARERVAGKQEARESKNLESFPQFAENDPYGGPPNRYSNPDGSFSSEAFNKRNKEVAQAVREFRKKGGKTISQMKNAMAIGMPITDARDTRVKGIVISQTNFDDIQVQWTTPLGIETHGEFSWVFAKGDDQNELLVTGPRQDIKERRVAESKARRSREKAEKQEAKSNISAPTVKAKQEATVEGAKAIAIPRSRIKKYAYADEVADQINTPEFKEMEAKSATERPSPRTGFTKTQTEYIAKTLEQYAKDYPSDAKYAGKGETEFRKLPNGRPTNDVVRSYRTEIIEPEMFAVPDDGVIRITDLQQANRLYKKITGKPLNSKLPTEKVSIVNDGVNAREFRSVLRGGQPTATRGNKALRSDYYDDGFEALVPIEEYDRQFKGKGVEGFDDSNRFGNKGEVALTQIKGQDAFTDGHYMLVGKPKAKISKVEVPTKQAKQIIDDGLKDAKPIKPLGYTDNNIIFSNDANVNPDYYDLIIDRYPDATFVGKDNSNDVIIVKNGKDVVGAIMPLKTDGGRAKQFSEQTTSDEMLRSVPIADIADSLYNADGKVNYEQVNATAEAIVSGRYSIQRLTPEGERGRIKSGRVGIESSLLVGTAKTPDTSSRSQKKADERALEEYARQKGIWFDYAAFRANNPYLRSGTEADVFRDSANPGHVIKLTPIPTSGIGSDALHFFDDKVALHNALPNTAPYEVVGYTRDDKGVFQVVLRQPFIKGEEITEVNDEFARLMQKDAGLFKRPNGGYANSTIEVNDVDSHNVIKTDDGRYIIIDPIISYVKNEDYKPFEIVEADRALRSTPDPVEVEVARQMAAVKEVRNDKGQLLAPNGKPSNLNEFQWKQVRTENFKEWAGENWENVVKDENGEPMVVYHGTNAKFDKFRVAYNDIGIHFGTTGQANDRLAFTQQDADGQNILPVYLAIQNPLRLTDIGWFDWHNVPDALEATGLFSKQELLSLNGWDAQALRIQDEYNEENDIDPDDFDNYDFEQSDDYKELQKEFGETVRDILERNGYDGVVYRNEGETAGGTELTNESRRLLVALQTKYGVTNSFNKEIQATPEYKAWTDARQRADDFRQANAEDSWIVLRPTQIKSAIGNRGTFDPTDPSILRSTPAQPFYSRVESVIRGKMPNRAMPAQITALLAKNGVKELDPEMQAIKVWLDGQDGTVSKDAVLEFVDANKVVVGETVKGDTEIKWNVDANGNYDATDRRGTTWELIPRSEIYEEYEVFRNGNAYAGSSQLLSLADAKALVASDATGDTSFAQFQLPGESENYREEFLTAPNINTDGWRVDWRKEGDRWQPVIYDNQSNLIDDYEFYPKTLTEPQIIERAAEKLNWEDGHSQYDDITNPIARIRYNDRVTTDGNKMLFAEEIQQPSKENLAKMPKVYQKFGEEMAIRKMLYRAVEGGYDYFGFTTGEQQADRYSLAKQVERINVEATETDGVYFVDISPTQGDTIYLEVEDGNVRSAANGINGNDDLGLQGKPLADVVGKDMAEKIFAVPQGELDEFSGDDLKIGGEGLKNRYDRKHVDYINKLMKPYGVSIESKKLSTLDTEASFDDGSEVVSIHAVRISPEFRKAVEASMRENGGAFPLFKLRNADDLADLEKLAQAKDFRPIMTALQTSVLEDANGANILSLDNNETSELFRTALAIYEDKDRGDVKVFDGLYLNKDQTQGMLDTLEGMRDAAVEKKLDTKALDAVIKNFEEATRANGRVRLETFENARRHETIHQQSDIGSDGKDYKTRYANADEIAKSPAFKKFHEALDKVQGKSTIGVAMEEALAYLGDGDFARFGLTQDEAKSILKQLIVGYAEANGLESLSAFDHTELYEEIESFRQSQSSEVGNDTRSGVDTEREARPRPAGRETRRDADGKGEETRKERLRSLPGTLREAGVDAVDEAYNVFGNQDAIEAANNLIADLGLEKAIKTLEASTTYDKTHAVMSFMLQRALRNEAAIAEQNGDAEYAQKLRDRGLELASRHAQLATQAGQFTQAAAMVADAVESVIYHAEKIAQKRGKPLTPVEYETFEKLGVQVENQSTDLTRLRKDIRNLKAQIKRLQDAKPRIVGTRVNKKAIAKAQSTLPDMTALIKQIREGLRDADTALRMVAWHGSPHVFDKFSLDKVGTGEGNQAYGHGLYFAGKESVADYYRNGLSSMRVILNGNTYNSSEELMERYRETGGDLPRAAAELYRFRHLGTTKDEILDAAIKEEETRVRSLTERYHQTEREFSQRLVNAFKELKTSKEFDVGKAGAKYRVNLAPAEDEYLLWDKPLSEQSEKVKKALEPLIDKRFRVLPYGNPRIWVWEEKTSYGYTLHGERDGKFKTQEEATADRDRWLSGERIYRSLSGGDMTPATAQAQAFVSNDLKSLGIRGIKYLDGTSRNQNLEQIEAKVKRAENRLNALKDSGNTEAIEKWQKELADAKKELEKVSYNYVIFDDADVEIQEVLRSTPDITRERLIQYGAAMMLDKPLSEISREQFADDIRKTFGNKVDDMLPQLFGESFNLRQEMLIKAKNELATESLKAEFPDKSDAEIKAELKKRENERKERRDKGTLAKKLARLYEPTVSKQKQDVIDVVNDIADPVVADYAEKIITNEVRPVARADRKLYTDAMTAIRDAHKILRDEELVRKQTLVGSAKALRDLEREEFLKRDEKRTTEKALARAYRRLDENPLVFYGKELLKILGESRSILASGDLSGSLRQGFYSSVTNPLMNLKGSENLPSSYGTMIKAITNKESFADRMKAVENHPDFDIMKQMGIEFAEAGGGVAEENIRTEYLKAVPIVKNWLNLSERTYAGFLDVQRALWAESVINELRAEDISFRDNPEVYKAAGALINIATGRGNIGRGKLKAAIEAFGGVFFAPRFVVSRAQLLGHVFGGMATLPPGLRKIEAKRAARFHTAISLPMLALIAAGIVAVDPDDDDFLKIRVGDKARYEVTGGLQQYVKLIAQLGMTVKNVVAGDQTLKAGTKTAVNKGYYFGVKKLAPVPSYINAALTGKEPDTTEFNWLGGILKRLEPITVREVRGAAMEDGVAGAILTAPTLFGIGVGYYPDKMKKAGSVDAMLNGPEVKRMTTDDLVTLLKEDYETPADKRKVEMVLKKKALAARKAGTLTQKEVDNIKKVLPDFNITARDIKKK